MFEKVKWLFFDVGSTLLDEAQAYQRRFEEIAQLAGVPCETVMDMALKAYRRNQKGDKEAAAHLCVPLHEWHSELEVPYADAEASLAKLSQHYHIGVIANQLPGTATRLEQHGLLRYIDLVIASAEEGVAKPNRRIFEIALERAGCHAEEAVMIGDRIDNDILPAKALGMGTVWSRQGFGQYWQITSEAEIPDCTVDNLSQLCERLEGEREDCGI